MNAIILSREDADKLIEEEKGFFIPVNMNCLISGTPSYSWLSVCPSMQLDTIYIGLMTACYPGPDGSKISHPLQIEIKAELERRKNLKSTKEQP